MAANDHDNAPHGDNIISQGETGDKFYILEEGKAYAEKSGKGRVFEARLTHDDNIRPAQVHQQHAQRNRPHARHARKGARGAIGNVCVRH